MAGCVIERGWGRGQVLWKISWMDALQIVFSGVDRGDESKEPPVFFFTRMQRRYTFIWPEKTSLPPPTFSAPPSLFRLSLWIKVTFPSSITMKEWSYIRIRYHPSCMTTMNHLINCPTEKVPPFLENTWEEENYIPFLWIRRMVKRRYFFLLIFSPSYLGRERSKRWRSAQIKPRLYRWQFILRSVFSL